jgi:hypothetical protein
MKPIALILFAVCALSGKLAAQTAPLVPDERLLAVFEADHLEKLRTESPLQLLRYNFYLDHGWFWADIPAGKAKGAEGFQVIPLAGTDRINIFAVQRELNLQRAFDRPTYYRVEGTDKVLVLRAEKTFARLFDAERRKRGF